MKIKLTDIDANLRETPSLTGNGNKVLAVKNDTTDVEWRSIQTFIEAPLDGKQYARQNGDWSPVVATGGSGGGGSGSTPLPMPELRGITTTTNSGSSIDVSIPAGAVEGDYAVFFYSGGNSLSVPTGWLIGNIANGNGWNAGLFTKTLTASDITAGKVTGTFNGSYSNSATLIIFKGNTYVRNMFVRSTYVPVGSFGLEMNNFISSDYIIAAIAGRSSQLSTLDGGTILSQQGSNGGYMNVYEFPATSGARRFTGSIIDNGGYDTSILVIGVGPSNAEGGSAGYPALDNNAGKVLTVKNDLTGVEWKPATAASTFTTLSDAPTTYVGQANRIPTVRSNETGLKFFKLVDNESEAGSGVDGNISPYGSHRYWKLEIAAGSVWVAPDINFYSVPGTAIDRTLATATVPNGNTYQGDTGSYRPQYAIDNSTTTLWGANDGIATDYIVDFKTPVSVTAVSWLITNNDRRLPKGWWTSYSDDGTTWTRAWNTDVVDWSPIANNAAYTTVSPLYQVETPAGHWVPKKALALRDVDADGIAGGQVLVWDAASSTFKPGNILPEAPADNYLYARKNDNWEKFLLPVEAPIEYIQPFVHSVAFNQGAPGGGAFTLPFTPKVGNVMAVLVGTNQGHNNQAGWTVVTTFSNGWFGKVSLSWILVTADNLAAVSRPTDSADAAVFVEIDKHTIADMANPLDGAMYGNSDTTAGSYTPTIASGIFFGALTREGSVTSTNPNAVASNNTYGGGSSNRYAGGFTITPAEAGVQQDLTYALNGGGSGVFFAIHYALGIPGNGLSSLPDVDFATKDPVQSDILTYNATAEKWQPKPGFNEAPTDGKQYARKNGAWIEVPPVVGYIPVANKSDDYTLQLGDGQSYLRFTADVQQICTVPTNASVAFPIGTQVNLRQAGIGVVLVSGASGVTVNYSADFLSQSRTKSSSIALIKVGTDEWDLMGDLEIA